MSYTQLIVPNGRPSALARVVNAIRSYTVPPLTLKSPELARKLGWGGQGTSTGISVTEDSALTYSAVWAAVNVISGDVASLPLLLYRRTGENSRERYPEHPLYRLIHDQPNPEMTSVVFRELLQAHVLTWGNGYAEIERDGVRRPRALWPITPDRVTPQRVNGRLEYKVRSERNVDVIIPREDMLHIPGLGFDGMMGYSVINKARESIGLGLAAERFGATFYGNGSTFGGVLSTDKQLSLKALENLRLALEARHQGVDRAHKLTVLEEGLKYEAIGVNPDDAQFLESRQFQVTEIARWFGVPPHKIADLMRATFSNIEQQDLDYFKTSLQHWIRKWEQELTSKLVFPLERTQQFIEFQVDGFLRGDSAGRAALEAAHFQIGALTPNDARAIENRNPLPGGDRGFVPLNMIPLDRVDEWITAQIKSKEAPKAAPAAPAAEPDPKQAARIVSLEGELRAMTTSRDYCKGEADRIKTAFDAFSIQAARDAEERAAEHQRYVEATALDLKALTDERNTAQGLAKEYDEQLKHARAGLTTCTNQRDDARATLASHQAAAATFEETRLDLVAQIDRLGLALVETQQKLGSSEYVRDAQQKANAERSLAVVLAHRALFVHYMAWIVERESDRARRQQKTPAMLKAWTESFYVTFEDNAVEALLPAVRVHLAWKQSADDPQTVTRALVKAHILESTRQLRSVADMEAHEWQAEFSKMLIRWAERRPEAFADALVAEEMAYVRSQQS